MPSNDNEAKWAYKPQEGSGESKQKQSKQIQPITWKASEFVDRHKSPMWYPGFLAGLALLSLAVFLITRDYISTGAIVLTGGILIVLAGRKPQQIQYEVDDKGIKVGKRFYPYTTFRSFGLEQEGGIKSINLVPLKRFMPEVSVYFPPDQEAEIIKIISTHLPFEEHVERTVDWLAKKLNF